MLQVIHARDRTFGQTALYLAAKQGNEDAVAILLQAKAQAFIPDRKGLTPLHIAAYLGIVRSVAINILTTLIIITPSLNPNPDCCDPHFLGYPWSRFAYAVLLKLNVCIFMNT